MEDVLICEICGHRANLTLQSHIRYKHNMPINQYKMAYPLSEIYSKIYREKIAEGNKKYLQDPEWVEKHREALKKAQNTPEAKLNHSNGANKYYSSQTPEEKVKQKETVRISWKNSLTRKNRVKALGEAHRSEEGRNNHSMATKSFHEGLTPEQKQAFRDNLKQTWAKPDLREKIIELSKIGLIAAMSPEGRARNKEAQNRPELREKRRIAAKKRLHNLLLNRQKYSGLNAFLKSKMEETGLNPIPEYEIGPYSVDFCFPDKRLVVEADGDWWHANPEFMQERRLTELHPIQKKMTLLDKRKNTYLMNHDWKLLRFWERDIKSNPEICLTKIKEILA